ncbi:TPA: Eaa protein [Salmonella enterica]
MTITKERLLKIQHWRETYGADSNVMLPAEEAEELARIALASLEVAPVGEVSEKRHGLVMDGTVDLGGKSTYRIIKGEKAMKRLPLGTKFYIAPPAPVVDADPVVFTDERNLHHIAMGRETSLIWGKQNQEVGDIPLYRHAQSVPVDKEFIPKNLDKALGVVGVALPESKEEFNFQIERWIQRLIDRVIRYADEFKEQPAPVVPDEMATSDDMNLYQKSFAQGYNACRAAMLHGDTFRENSISSTNNFREIAETSTNSPAIPDDWVMVPKEPTQAMIKAWLSEVANFRGHAAGYKAALAAAPQREVK